MRLMSRSEFVLISQRDSQPNAGPKNASTQKWESYIEGDTFRDAINIRERIRTLFSCV